MELLYIRLQSLGDYTVPFSRHVGISFGKRKACGLTHIILVNIQSHGSHISKSNVGADIGQHYN